MDGGWCECRQVGSGVVTADGALMEDKWSTDGGRTVASTDFQNKVVTADRAIATFLLLIATPD